MISEGFLNDIEHAITGFKIFSVVSIVGLVLLVLMVSAAWSNLNEQITSVRQSAFEIKNDQESSGIRIFNELYELSSDAHDVYSDIIDTYNYIEFVDSKLVRIANHLGLEMSVTTEQEIKEAGCPGDPE